MAEWFSNCSPLLSLARFLRLGSPQANHGIGHPAIPIRHLVLFVRKKRNSASSPRSSTIVTSRYASSLSRIALPDQVAFGCEHHPVGGRVE